MPRSPLPDDASAQDLVPEGTRRLGGRFEGAFRWPHDIFFRPMVGVYAADRLQLLAPTWRRPGPDGWLCHFSIVLPPELRGRRDLSIACLETGEILHAPLAPPAIALLRVEDILASGRRQAGAFAYGGFPVFLRLSLPDQVKILYLDFLHRDASHAEVDSYCRRIAAGELSLLEARDEFAASEEARNKFAVMSADGLAIDERRGRLCLWQGLELVVDGLVPPPLGPGAQTAPTILHSSLEAIRCPSGIPAILARNAIGPHGDIGLYARWMQEHGEEIARQEIAVAQSAALRRVAAPVRRRYRLANMLAALHRGEIAARQPDGVLRARAGRPGIIAFGPYMQLTPGQYRFTCGLEVEAPADEPAQVGIEIVHGDVLFARRDLHLARAWKGECRLGFTLAADTPPFIREPGFEFRISTNGNSVVHVTRVELDFDSEAPPPAALTPVDAENWLPSLRPGGAGVRQGEGIAAMDQAGCVFFGPYCRLLPGDYVFSVDCVLEASAAQARVTLEIAAETDELLAQKCFRLTPGGNHLSIPFTIPRILSRADLPGPLEFRLLKEDNSPFICGTARLLRAAQA